MVKQRVIIWGAGEFGRNAVECYIPDMISIEILAITDRDDKKWGQEICGVPIIPYMDIGKLNYDKILIFSPKYADEIYQFICADCAVAPEKIEIIGDCAYFIYKRVEEKYSDVNLNNISDAEKRKAVQYLKGHEARMFCYDFPDNYMNREVKLFYDNSEQMHYVLHDGKKLYLPAKFPNEEEMRKYYNSMVMEQDSQSPHLYQSDKVKVKEGDVLLDVGAAEGFFALSVIDKVSYVYLVEADEEWERALRATFRPYMDKVQIISKFASNKTGGNEVTVDDIIGNQKLDFVKMDIEGAERMALAGTVNTLKSHNLQCSICTYHKDNDYSYIRDFFQSMNYQCEASEGYILCGGIWEKDNREIDFRKGVLRSWKD